MSRMGLTTEVKERVTIYNCKVCRKWFARDRGYEDEESAIGDFLRHELGDEELKGATYRLAGDMLYLTLKMESDGMEREIKKTLLVVRKLIVCRHCGLMKASYFNVTIQVRAPKPVLGQIVAEIREHLHELSHRDSYAFISGEKVLREGIDLMVGSKSAAEKAVNAIKKRHDATIKVSRKLYGLVEGKKTYRDTILVSIGK